MAYTYVFANVTSFTTPQLDDVLNEAGKLGTIPCTVTGTNDIVMTPLTTPTAGTPPFALQPQIRLSGIAAATNTGAMRANVSGSGLLNVYQDGAAGPAALTGGEIVIGNYFVLAYDATLNTGAGGWHLENVLIGGAPTGAAGGDLDGTYPDPTVAQINGVALGSTTAAAGALLVGSGTEWVTKAVSGDATLAAGGALTVTKTGGVSLTGGATMSFVAPTGWTPADGSGAALAFVGVSANYVRLGNLVFAYFSLTYPATADGSNAVVSGLPIAVPAPAYATGPAAVSASGGAIAVILSPVAGGSTAAFFNHATGAAVTNANLSGLTLRGMLVYPVA